MLILILLYIFDSDQCPWAVRVLGVDRRLDRLRGLGYAVRVWGWDHWTRLELWALEPISEVN